MVPSFYRRSILLLLSLLALGAPLGGSAFAAKRLRVVDVVPCEFQLLSLGDIEPEPDDFYLELAEDPLRIHKEMERSYTRAMAQGRETFSFLKARPVLLRIISDLNHRLEAGSVLELPQFKSFYDQLAALRSQAFELFQRRLPYSELNLFIIKWEETMSALLRSADPSLSGTYHRDIAGPELKDLMKQGEGTYIFFTFHDVDDEYFWAVRPAGIYLHGLMPTPRFAVTAANYSGGPLVPTASIRYHIDGYPLDLDEFTKHDAGHSAFMRRRDLWLFQTMGFSREDLVRQWMLNERHIKAELKKLKAIDPDLAAAVAITLAEVIHERGYQFYLPILQQQLSTSKWTDVIRKKLLQDYWSQKPVNQAQVLRLDEARQWLLSLVSAMAIDATIESMGKLKARNHAVVLRRWLSIQTFRGRPQRLWTQGPGSVVVRFDIKKQAPQATSQTTSLYEVSLAQIRVGADPLLPVATIDLLERLSYAKKLGLTVGCAISQGVYVVSDIHITMAPQISGQQGVEVRVQLVPPGSALPPLEVPLSNIILPTEVMQGLPEEARFSKVEVFKMEQILTLQARSGATEFTQTPQPEIYQSVVTDLNLKDLTLEIQTPQGPRRFPIVETSLHPGEP